MLDLSKPIQLRDGRAVRILCTDRLGNYPIVGLYLSNTSPNREVVGAWKTGGALISRETPLDLVNVKVKKWRWGLKGPMYGIVTDKHYTEAEVKDICISPTFTIIGKIESTEIEE